MQDRHLKRLRKKAKKGNRGWPVATIAFYGPDISRASKVVASIVPFEDAECADSESWTLQSGDVRNDPAVALAILEFIKLHGALSIVMSGIIGCPHQEGIDYDGHWCPHLSCTYWVGRDRLTAKMLQ